jgi:hypothetical protein
MKGENIQAPGCFCVACFPGYSTGKITALVRIGKNTMTDLSRRAVIKATGAVGASMLSIGLATMAQAPPRSGLPSHDSPNEIARELKI